MPGAGDVVYITNSGSYTVYLDNESAVTELHLGGSSGVQTLSISQQLSLSTGTVATNGRLQLLTYGVNAASLDVAGAIDWSGGQLRTAGTILVRTNGLLRLTGADVKDLAGQVQNEGRIEFDSTAALYLNGTWGSAALNNRGTLAILQGLTINSFGGTGSMINHGLLQCSSGDLTLNINALFTNSAVIDVPANAALTLFAPEAGKLFFENGTTFTGNGVCRLPSISQAAADGQIYTKGTFEFGGIISGNSEWSGSGKLEWYGGQSLGVITLASNLQVSAWGMQIGDYSLNNNAAVTNNTTINWVQGPEWWAGRMLSYGTFVNNGVFVLKTNLEASAPFENRGTIFTQSGIDSSDSSRSLTVSATFRNFGTIAPATNTTLDIMCQSGSSLSFEDGTRFGGGLTDFHWGGAGATATGLIVIDGTFKLEGWLNGTSEWTGTGVLDWAGGEFQGHVRFASGLKVHSAASMISSTGVVTNDTTIVFDATDWYTNFYSGGLLVNQGALIFASPCQLNGQYQNLGTVGITNGNQTVSLTGEFNNFGRFYTPSNTTFRIVPYVSYGVGHLQIFDGTVFDGAGRVVLDWGQPVTSYGRITVNGVLELNGTLNGDSEWTGIGRLDWFGGMQDGTMRLLPPLQVQGAASMIGWSGLVTNQTHFVWNASNGNTGFYNAGTFRNEGTFELTTDCGVEGQFINDGVLCATNGAQSFTVGGQFQNFGILLAHTNSVLSMSANSYGQIQFHEGTTFNGSGITRLGWGAGTAAAADGAIVVNGTFDQQGLISGVSSWKGFGALLWSGEWADGSVAFETGLHVSTPMPYTLLSNATMTNRAELRCSGTQFYTLANSFIRNEGTFIVETNSIINGDGFENAAGATVTLKNGTLAVNAPLTNYGILDLRRGTIVFNNQYTPTPESRHIITVAGYQPVEEYPTMQFASPSGIVLDGKFSVVLTNGFLPTNGSIFPVASFVSRSGDFSSYQYPPLTNRLGWRSELGDFDLTLHVDKAPYFFSQPVSQIVNQGTNVTFTIAIDGTTPIGIQWFLNDAPIQNATNTFITLLNVQTNDAGIYRIVLSNNLTTATSSNIILRVIADATRPGIAVVTPADNLRTNVGTISLVGKATDNIRVTQVMFKLNSGDFQQIALTNGGRSIIWSTTADLVPGSNTVAFKCVDMAGNESLATVRRVFYVVTNQLNIAISGNGDVYTVTNSPVTNGTWLEIGRGYTVKAVPRPGNLFAGWSGDVSGTNATLRFIMSTNLTLHANFVTNQCIVAAGVYNGLFYEATNVSHQHDGFSTITLRTNGSFSGRVNFDGDALSFSGQFNPFACSHVILPRVKLGKPDVSLDLVVDISTNRDVITGTVGDGTWSSPVWMDRNVYTTNLPSTNFNGSYTMLIPGGDGTTSPMGYGYGTITVRTNGLLTFSGMLPDNSKLSQSVTISKDGHWPMYAPMYLTKYVTTNTTNSAVFYTNSTYKGCLIGWVNFGDSPISGTLAWVQNSYTNFYPAGFTNVTDLMASRYVAPTNKVQTLTATNGLITVTGGNLPMDIVATAKLTNNVFTIGLPNTNKLKASIVPASGQFVGSFITTSNKARVFNGAVLQDRNVAGGFFIGTNTTGKVEFTPFP